MNEQALYNVADKQFELIIEAQGKLEEKMNSPFRSYVKEAKALAEIIKGFKDLKESEELEDYRFFQPAYTEDTDYFEPNSTKGMIATLEKVEEWDNIRFMSDKEYQQYKRDNL